MTPATVDQQVNETVREALAVIASSGAYWDEEDVRNLAGRTTKKLRERGLLTRTEVEL